MGEQSGGREGGNPIIKFQLCNNIKHLGFFLFCFVFLRVCIHFCANQPNVTYSETVFCKSVAVGSMYFEMPLYLKNVCGIVILLSWFLHQTPLCKRDLKVLNAILKGSLILEETLHL